MSTVVDPYHISYREIGPPEDLKDIVLSFWEMDVSRLAAPSYDHRIDPEASTSIVLARSSVGPAWKMHVVGPRTEALVVPIHEGEWFSGLRFIPGIASQLFRFVATDQVSTMGPVSEMLPHFASILSGKLGCRISDELAVGVLADVVRESVPLDYHPDLRIVEAFRAVWRTRGLISVKALAQQIHTSDRQTQRLFQKHIGLSPKQVIRLVRLRATAEDALHQSKGSWSRIAADRGFSDQAHLTREVKELTGVTPATLEGSVRRIEHIELQD